MTVNRTTLLDLPLPVTGTESGTWGDTTNNGLTQYLDIAIAGTLVLSTDADVTLTSTEGDSSATNIGATTAQYAILRWTATGSTTRNITALAQSKTYVVINATGGTQSIVLRGAGPTTGITIISGEKAFCVWNGSDFVKVSSSAAAGGSNTQVQYNSSGVLAGSSNLTFDGTSLTLGGNPTLSAGTANGVLYLNGSKVATSGSALVFNEATTRLGVGVASPAYTIDSGGIINTASAIYWGAGVGKLQFSGSDAFIDSNGSTIFRISGSTEQMRLTSTGLGIGTSSPAAKLDVLGLASSIGLKIRGGGNSGINILDIADAGGSGSLVLNASGNLGIGTSLPGYKLDVVQDQNAATYVRSRNNDAGSSAYAGVVVNAFGNSWAMRMGSSAANSNALQIVQDALGTPSVRATFDTSGNLGLGVTPSAWGSSTALQVGSWASLSSANTYGTGIGFNNFYNGTNDIYSFSNAATKLELGAGVFKFFTAPYGTAGNAITFTQAMTLDASGNLGVGITSFSYPLSLYRGAGVACYAEFVGNAQTTASLLIGQDAAGLSRIFQNGANPISFWTNATERARITSGGNFKIGGTADRGTTEGDKQLVLFNGTAPVGTLTNGISLYSSSGEAYVMDAAGNATLFSPHDRDTNEWIFRSKHTPSGKVLKIDVERLLRFVNDHFGLDAVQEFIEP